MTFLATMIFMLKLLLNVAGAIAALIVIFRSFLLCIAPFGRKRFTVLLNILGVIAIFVWLTIICYVFSNADTWYNNSWLDLHPDKKEAPITPEKNL